MNFLKSRRARDRSFSRRLPMMILALVVVTFTTAQVQANTISITSFNVSGPVLGEYTWSYTIQLSSLSSLSAGSSGGGDLVFPDMLEIFDFGSYVPGSINWAPNGGNPQFNFNAVDSIFTDHAVENILFPSGVPAGQDGATRNLKINYSGAGFVNNGVNAVTLGVLSAKSTSNTQVVDFYISTDTTPLGLTGTNFSGVFVPAAASPVAVLPTPHAVTGGLALFGLLLVPKARRRLLGV
jgi:hypothetical protein